MTIVSLLPNNPFLESGTKIKIISDDNQPVKFLSTDTLTITIDGVSASIDLSTLANGD